MSGELKSIARGTLLFIVLSFVLCACTTTKPETNSDVKQGSFNIRSVAKNDINRVMDIYVHEIRKHLKSMMVKLYKRNPRELKKSPYPNADENINRVFSRSNNWHFRELDGVHGADAITLSFRSDYKGDRVFCFMMGLTSMVMSSYNNKTDFFMYDNIDPQGLYNSAVNIKIAICKLSYNRVSNGKLFLLSNSMDTGNANISYERLFGKMIAMQDTMAVIVAGKTNRTISKVIQRMATAVFLPIP